MRAVHARTYKRVVMVVGAQMGKSDSILDIIGERMDTAPVPMLYLGPDVAGSHGGHSCCLDAGQQGRCVCFAARHTAA